jgi:spermidine/putrescine ABC transporter ATP-binding subunit
MSEPAVETEDLVKKFGELRAVDGVSFEIQEGEFFSLLGPSGCGKSTTLRMLAGFDQATSGTVRIDGEVVNEKPPYERDVGMVFQSYALFPHKTVGENVGFGLKMEGVPSEERETRVEEILDLVGLPAFEDRSPSELSGGQQQRVALARALVIEPSVLLLDEPLSNLDLKLRKEMQFELKRIQTELDITTIYVTHDQEEALSMSDEILVMNEGGPEQVGSPRSVYNQPKNEFVADFMGESNLIAAKVIGRTQAGLTLEVGNQDSVTIPEEALVDGSLNTDSVALSLRSEDLRISDRMSGNSGIHGSVANRTFRGKVTTYLVDIGEETILVETPGRNAQEAIDIGADVNVTWDEGSCLVLGR